jgi:hypothetical protein
MKSKSTGIVFVSKKRNERRERKLENDAVSRFGGLRYDVMHIIHVPYDSGHKDLYSSGIQHYFHESYKIYLVDLFDTNTILHRPRSHDIPHLRR